MSILHPIIGALSPKIYSIANGNYFLAFLVYSMAFITHICALIIDVKYLLIGLERKFAFEKRHKYEEMDGTLARRFFLIVVSVDTLILHLYKDHQCFICRYLFRV